MVISEIQEITSAGEGLEKKKSLYTIGRDLNPYNNYGKKKYGGSSKILS